MKVTHLALLSLTWSSIALTMDIPVPAGALTEIRNAGVTAIMATIERVNKNFADALNAFKPVNATCVKSVNREVTLCTNCVKSKCESRAKSECKPEKWEEILGKAVKVIKDVPDFLFKQVPDVVFKELPNKIIDVTKDIGHFLKDKVLDKVVDVHKKIGKGAIDIAKGLGDVGGKAVKEIGRVGERVGKEAGRVVESVGKEIGRFGERVGKEASRFFRRIFGKRRLHGAQRRLAKRSEPSCGDFENNAEQACKTYLQPAYCPSCGFDPMTRCAGYAAALNKIKAAEKARDWLLKVQNNDYNILSMTFSMNSQGQFVNVKATVNLFGKQFSFNVGSVNPYLPDQAGPKVANIALNMYKLSV